MRHIWTRLFGRRKQQTVAKKTTRLFKFLIITPCSLLLALVIGFFCFDDFHTYVILLFSHQASSQHLAGYNGVPDDWTVSPGGSPIVPGEAGVRAMYVNKMSGGYYKEYLEIVRDHVNGKQMQPSVSWPRDTEGRILYPSITMFIGFSIKETGTADGTVPYTMLNMDSYGKSDEKTLYQWNSTAVAENDVSHLPNGLGKDLLWNNYYTQLQHQKGYAAIYPTGATGSGSRYYPSLLNGYKITEGSVRTQAQHDAAYFPDQVSMVIQFINSQYNLLDASAKESAGAAIVYPCWNGGPGLVQHSWSVGAGAGYSWTPANDKFSGSSSKWHESNTVTPQACASEAANTIVDLYETASQKIETAASQTSFNYLNGGDYNGFEVAALLLNGGFIASDKSLSGLQGRIDSAAFIRGAWTAYRIYKDANATKEQVQEWLRGITIQSVDTDFYGPVCTGKTYSSGSPEIVVHMYGNIQVYNRDGAGPKNVLHAYPTEATSGSFMTQIGGLYSYWKMLKAAGVECTFNDAFKDTLGLVVDNAGSKPGGGAGNYNNTSIARAAVSFAYATRDEGVGNDGTPLYQAVHRAVMGNDPYFQSCDRCVCAAVRWSGADDTYPLGGCSVQLPYLRSSPKWQEVTDWNGDYNNLQPGDVLIRSDIIDRGYRDVGHTLLYTGNALILEKYPNSPAKLIQVSASYMERSPGCGSWYSDAAKGYQTYRVFRNVQKEENSKYANVEVNVSS